MAGDLVGLVIRHGPSNHGQWAILVAIAEELRGPLRHARLTDADLAERTRMGRTAVKTAVTGLRAGGWVGGRRGTNNGVASTYCLALDKFPEEEVAAVLNRSVKGSANDPYSELGLEGKGSANDPFNESRGRQTTQKGSANDPLSVSVTTPFPPAEAADHLDGVLVGVRNGPDDKTTNRALRSFPVPNPSETLRGAIGAAIAAGWTPADIDTELVANVDVRNCRDVPAVLVGRIRKMADRTPPARTPAQPVHRAIPREHLVDPVTADEAMATMRAAVARVQLEAEGAAKQNGAASGRASKTGPERLAAAGMAPAFDPFKPRRKRTG